MIKSKLGYGMNTSDKDVLDKLLNEAITVCGAEYGDVLEYVVNTITSESFPSSLKSHALQKSSWFKKYVYEYVQTH